MGKEGSETLTWIETMLAFIESHFISLVFAALFFGLIVFLLKLNFGNGHYKNFHLASMISRSDGSLDRKAVERVSLFLMSMYGFLHVLHKIPEQIVPYFWAMTGTWLGMHVLANKLPDRSGPPKDKEDAGHP